ncbi:hypothetical protein [Streptomyces lavendulae]|uniref:hypothetical protein n=1 Tax=Streptomyces lavendulae TaxID=1914 RepID=UPI0036EC4771
MLTGIVIDALDVARMDRFWQEATRGRTDGLRLRFERRHAVTPDRPSSGARSDSSLRPDGVIPDAVPGRRWA